MKLRYTLFFACILFSPAFLAAQETTFFVASNLSTGQVRELVYFQDELLSELVWPLDTLTTLTMGSSFPLGYGFSFASSLETGMLLSDQKMTDTDWMNLPQSKEKTHYSQHTATIDHYFEFQCLLKRLFKTPLTGPKTNRNITVTPGVEFRFTSLAWTAKDGYAQYGTNNGLFFDSWTSTIPKYHFSGEVVTYSQTRVMLAGNISISIPLSSQFLLTTSFSASPLIQCNAKDEHILTNTLYEDFMVGGLFFEPKLRIDYRPQENRIVFLSCTWTNLHNLRESSRSDLNGAGSDMSKLSFSLGYSLVQ